MKNFKTLAVVFTAATLSVFTSCEKESSEDVVDHSSQEISKDVLNKVTELHFNPNGIEKGMVRDIDGSQKMMYTLEGDIKMSYDQIMKMNIGEGVQSKQYRSNNLVNTPKTIRVVGYNGNNRFGLSSVAQRGLQYAIANYNALNIDIQLNLVFSTSFNSSDILVYTETTASVILQDGVRGVAGFPSGGEPFKRVKINGGANTNNDDQLLEGLFTHELGHCFGLRHTDWNTRQSCGQSGESAGSTGATHIPGTPGASQDSSSIMNACFPYNEGEFGQYDKVALEYLY
ncbi:dual-action HEIGH metallo-peptidase [Aquimarina sp. MAR_2010_214]|uniref:M57 family metalloprotease n=1 Tax=Aquimarina sp. MAR_2010_214 TaxID=1250026 RepID=UPI000C7150D8|nr:M57 family metalloprotease [Aquimarina sp. MAR_2010_214]PKV52546.1 dual-action HEIGH metallo-peptidase [Aquimarina sp. MAR_2010_214]